MTLHGWLHKVEETTETTEKPISDVCTSLSGTPTTGATLSFSLPNLSPGNYQASLMLQGIATVTSPVPKRFSRSTKTKRFRVVPRKDTLPLLVTPLKDVECVIESEQQQREGVLTHIPHAITAKDASILQADNVQVCVRLYTPASSDEEGPSSSGATADSSSATNSSVRSGVSCVPVYAASGLLSVGMLGEGLHHYELALQEEGDWIAAAAKVVVTQSQPLIVLVTALWSVAV